MKETIIAEIYCAQLERVQEKLLEKQPDLVNRKKVLFLQDKARMHVAKKTVDKITQLGWEIMCHPPYSSDLSPTNYYILLGNRKFFLHSFFSPIEFQSPRSELC